MVRKGYMTVKPTDSRWQENTLQQTASQLRLELSFVPPRSVPEEIETAFFALPLAQCFASPEPLQALSVDLGAVAHAAPKKRGFIVTFGYFGADVRDEIAGINAGVDKMERAPNLVWLAVI